jgi:hypothetical protein
LLQDGPVQVPFPETSSNFERRFLLVSQFRGPQITPSTTPPFRKNTLKRRLKKKEEILKLTKPRCQ